MRDQFLIDQKHSYVVRFYINTSVAHQKMADDVKNDGSSVNGNNMSTIVRHHIFYLYLKIVVLKYVEQPEQL
jgi:hypothetical protein